ncbi:MarR family transcriptional regulator [Amycolatopsis antarctica]|uniref:MarR family transcriptional regulator n=1 Tax=Amycolatopsis antarctica TaxID=1854586 RepID=A0A263CWP4_9PSEU|nr:MarR family transcriptional regulator [Amycolatopsis antarctica]OZM70564.1 MarR family transcriptional regulator [Amycolatopsis antarctica]
MPVVERETSLASRLRVSVVRLNRRLRAQRTSQDVSLTQVSALSTLHKCGPMSPGKLAVREGVQPPSMTRVIAALEDLGYVDRSPHPTDGRQSIVELSPTGLEYVQAVISAREVWLEQQLEALSEEERETLSHAAEIIERMAEQ